MGETESANCNGGHAWILWRTFWADGNRVQGAIYRCEVCGDFKVSETYATPVN